VHKLSPTAVVWRNLTALMELHWGEVHLLRLATEARVAQSTISRIKAQKSSPTADMLFKLARVFRLQAWQLLDPRLDPRTAQMRALGMSGDAELIAWPFTSMSPEEFARIPLEDQKRVEGFAQALVPKTPK
jgi:transcriptional regulator with XRE-family HTH domain